MTKKVLYIATRYPYPQTTGRHKMIAQNLDNLSKNYELSLAFFGEGDLSISPVHFNQTIRLGFPSIVKVFFNLLWRRDKSLQENLFFSSKGQNILLSCVRENNFDIVICDMVRTAQFLEGELKGTKILDLDDLLSLRYQRAITNSNYSLLGTFKFPKSIRFLSKLISPFSKLFLKWEAKKIEKREVELAKSFDATYLVSPKETKTFSEKVNARVFCNPPAVRKRELIYTNASGENKFLFLGNFASNQNYESIVALKEIIIPILDKHLSKFEILLIGASDGRLEKLISGVSELKYLGFVEDLESTLSSIKMAIVPIAYGTGIKTKLLDIMSYGIPVVTNQVGGEGLHFDDEFIVRDTFEQCGEMVLQLVENPDQLLDLSKKGFHYVQQFHEELIRNEFLQQIELTIER